MQHNRVDLFNFFEPAPLHNPGGKVKTKLPPYIIGDAHFHGAHGEYRTWLSRYWGAPWERDIELAGGFDVPHAILIGMNPSTADAEANDPTIKREIDFVNSWGFHAFVKFNVSDYRATKPSWLSRPGVVPVSDQNLPMLRQFAKNRVCKTIVLCYGNVPKVLKPHAMQLVSALQADGHKLWCFGRTKDGNPMHPLYLKTGTPLEPFSL